MMINNLLEQVGRGGGHIGHALLRDATKSEKTTSTKFDMVAATKFDKERDEPAVNLAR
ncbi:hypothetical protein J1N35_038189 [Gossypium stocksii]|uniref:Uncharacterized protein n=1 Tax=Gossypium stocksii TaxID=47602 RepID=A0A9D3ZMM4_9ROSI|nr:hypothetical protein J1N35_038189 [Gossypium stocksii]